MRQIDFLVIPGILGSINIDDITYVRINEECICIDWKDPAGGMCDCKYLLKGNYMPDFILNAAADDYFPFHILTDDEFKKYMGILQKIIKINVIDPLKEV